MKYLNENGLEYFWGKIKTVLDSKKDKIIDTRTYTGYYNVGSNEVNNRDVFCFKITRNSYYETWRLKCRITAETPNYPNSGIYTNWEIDYYGYQNNVKAQYIKVNHGTYCALTAMLALYPTDTSDNELYFGFACGSVSGNQYTKSAYARTVVVDLLEFENCEVEMLDDLLWWKNMTQANYTIREVALTTSGYQETGDADTTNYFIGCLNASLPAKLPIHAYALCGMNADKTELIPIAQGTSGTGTAKTPQTTYGLKPDFLYYRYVSTAIEQDGNTSGSSIRYQSSFDLRYSMNWTTENTKYDLYSTIYLVGTIGNDGLFYVANVDPWIVDEKTDITKAYWQFGRINNSNGYGCDLYENTTIWIYDTAKSDWVEWAPVIGAPAEISSDDITAIIDDLEEETPTNQNNYLSKRGLLSLWAGIKALFTKCKTLVIDCGTVSSLPKTVNNSAITEDHVCVKAELGNVKAQNGNWTVTTANGSLTVSGNVTSGKTTTLKLFLILKQ